MRQRGGLSRQRSNRVERESQEHGGQKCTPDGAKGTSRSNNGLKAQEIKPAFRGLTVGRAWLVMENGKFRVQREVKPAQGGQKIKVRGKL